MFQAKKRKEKLNAYIFPVLGSFPEDTGGYASSQTPFLP
jgi:hypothetical protein